MKIQLDTGAKTIKLDSNVKLKDLVDTLSKLLPNGEWKEFTLETNTVIEHWSSPIVIKEYIKQYPTYPSYPWYISNGTAYTAKDNNMVLCANGQFNVEA